MLAGYEEAELVAARVGASKMGFFVSGDGAGYTGTEDAFGKQHLKEPLQDKKNGQFRLFRIDELGLVGVVPVFIECLA
jgi:hypothetical protein